MAEQVILCQLPQRQMRLGKAVGRSLRCKKHYLW